MKAWNKHPNATPTITVADWQHWEVRRHIDSETPGKHGTFTSGPVAA